MAATILYSAITRASSSAKTAISFSREPSDRVVKFFGQAQGAIKRLRTKIKVNIEVIRDTAVEQTIARAFSLVGFEIFAHSR